MSPVAPEAYQRHYPAPAEPVTVPAPEHTSRDPWPEGFVMPRGPRLLVQHAECHGWSVGKRYSRGWRATRAGKAMPHAETISLRMVKGDRWAHVFYQHKLDQDTDPGWEFDGSLVPGSEGGIFPYANITEIRAYLAADAVLPGWYETGRKRAAKERTEDAQQ